MRTSPRVSCRCDGDLTPRTPTSMVNQCAYSPLSRISSRIADVATAVAITDLELPNHRIVDKRTIHQGAQQGLCCY
jgi:hypothetical protein